MSEPVVKHRPTVDLDQYERRLRDSSHPHAHEEDPLAELARLVGEQPDPYGDVFAQEARPHPAAYVAPRDADHPSYDGRQEPAFGEAPPVSPRLFGDFAAIEAGLRGSNAPHADSHHAQPAQDDQSYYDDQHGYAPAGEDAAYQHDGYAPAAAAPARSRRPVYAIAATIAVAVIGIGTAFALKGSSTTPGQVKTIMAAAGPTKIQPPADAVQDQNGQDASVLGQAQPAPTKLVNHEEQPVDLAQAVQDNAARDAAPASGPADAASVPVPLSPSQAQQGDGVGGFGLNGMPAPKKVKVVSVRPDGTILPNDQPPAAAIPAPRLTPNKTSDHVGPVAKASTPKTTTPKTTSRVVTTPKTIESAANDDGNAPAPAKPAKKVKPQPQRMASADTGAQEATDAVSPKATAGSGSFAVQLAAPGSESEAKAASTKLGKKYADALGGHHLGFHKAESNGKSVYRVRVSSLTKEDAVSLCEKLKAGGGSCFVAKN